MHATMKNNPGSKRLQLPPSLVLHFFVTNGKIEVSFFYKFATNCDETSHIYLIRHDKSTRKAYFFVCIKKCRKSVTASRSGPLPVIIH